MKTGIIGLPMTGKTSLFTILTGVTQESHIGSTAVRLGVAKVPDPRVEALAELYRPPKITFATVEYVDAPAISKETLRDPAFTGEAAKLNLEISPVGAQVVNSLVAELNATPQDIVAQTRKIVNAEP